MEKQILNRLYDPATFEREALALSTREFYRGYCYDVPTGLAWLTLLERPKPLCGLLASEFRESRYEPDPVKFSEAWMAGKRRRIAKLSFRDRLVHGAVARVLHEAFEPIWDKNLFSFRRQRSNLMAVQKIVEHATRHRKKTATVKQGLYVFRGDVKDYTDSISPAASSPLWKILSQQLEVESGPLVSLLTQLLSRASEVSPSLPFGSPLTPFFANLFLHPLDLVANQDPELAHFRYGDDVFAVSDDPEKVLYYKKSAAEYLAALGLEWNESKLRLLYWTSNGASSVHPEFQSNTQMVEYLGLSVHFRHGIGLSQKHLIKLKGEILERIYGDPLEIETQGNSWQRLGELWKDLEDCKRKTALESAHLIKNAWNPSQMQELRQWVLQECSQYLAKAKAPRCYRVAPKNLLHGKLGPLWSLEQVKRQW